MVVREEPLSPASGFYNQSKGWCCEAIAGWILTERILSPNPRPGKAYPMAHKSLSKAAVKDQGSPVSVEVFAQPPREKHLW